MGSSLVNVVTAGVWQAQTEHPALQSCVTWGALFKISVFPSLQWGFEVVFFCVCFSNVTLLELNIGL